jgi:predicted nucleic acid-binding protein
VIWFADTSALVRAYLADEPEHDELRELLLENENDVVASELSRVEFARAVTAAGRANRLRRPDRLIALFDADTAGHGPVSLVRLLPDDVFPRAHELVRAHRLGTVDAMHLAVVLTTVTEFADGEDITIVTRDDAQAEAARELGFTVE